MNKNVAKALARLSLAGVVTCGLSVSANALTTEEILNYKGADREKILLEGARKEGQVVFYSAMIVNQALRPVAEGFMKKYPFLKATYWRGDSEDIAAKLTAEIRANNLVADVVEGTGVGEMVIQSGLVQPYYTPVINEFPEKYRDPRNLWTPTRLSYFGVAYNTRLVKPEDAPKTYDDLLDPKWQGKLSWRIGSASGTPLFITNIRMSLGEDKARDYFDKLAKQKVVNFGSGSARTLVDRVMAGEYPLALNIFAHHPLISKAKGAPVNTALLDPVPTTAATMVIPKGVKRPHAAMLLVDYVLSVEGQKVLAQAEYFPARLDVPPLETIAGVVPQNAKVRENFVGSEDLNKFTESSEAIFQEKFR